MSTPSYVTIKGLYDQIEESNDHTARSIVHNMQLSSAQAQKELQRLGYSSSSRAVDRARIRYGLKAKPAGEKARDLKRSDNQTITLFQISDWQVGAHDRDYIMRTIEFARALQPDIIVHTGDEADQTVLGRWVTGKKEEFAETLWDEYQTTRELFTELRNACPDAEIRLCRSNHGDRLEKSIQTRLPGLASLTGPGRPLNVQSLLGLEALDIHYDRENYEVLPGLIYFHGDAEKFTSQTPIARIEHHINKKGKSFLFGHTHRAGIFTASYGYNWDMQTRFAMNVGHAMDLKAARYIESGCPNWTQGVGIVRYNGEQLFPELILAQGGHLMYQGQRF